MNFKNWLVNRRLETRFKDFKVEKLIINKNINLYSICY